MTRPSRPRPLRRTKGRKIVCPHCRPDDPRRWWDRSYYAEHLRREHPKVGGVRGGGGAPK